MNWSIFLAAGGSASIEFLETAVIAYAIARSGYAREAILGSVVGIVSVGLASIASGTSLQVVPLHWLQIGVGAILLWFGWGWVKKSVLRQAQGQRAGWMVEDPLTAEGITLQTEAQGFSQLNFLIMAKSAALEAFEVAVIVTTLGLASGAWAEALEAVFVSLLFSIGLVVVLHRHLVKVPEVLIKLIAGILLCAFGTFWLGEGLGLEWWFGDGMIILIAIIYAFSSIFAIYGLRRRLEINSQIDSSVS